MALHKAACIQAVLCALAFLSCRELSAQLVSMGTHEQATLLQCLALEDLAWDAQGLTQAISDTLLT